MWSMGSNLARMGLKLLRISVSMVEDSCKRPMAKAALDFTSASSSLRRWRRIFSNEVVEGVTVEPMARIHSAMTPTDVIRS